MYIRYCCSHLSYFENGPSAAEAKLSADMWPIERLMLFLSLLLGIGVSWRCHSCVCLPQPQIWKPPLFAHHSLAKWPAVVLGFGGLTGCEGLGKFSTTFRKIVVTSSAGVLAYRGDWPSKMKALQLFEMSAATTTHRYISEDLDNKFGSFNGIILFPSWSG